MNISDFDMFSGSFLIISRNRLCIFVLIIRKRNLLIKYSVYKNKNTKLHRYIVLSSKFQLDCCDFLNQSVFSFKYLVPYLRYLLFEL